VTDSSPDNGRVTLAILKREIQYLTNEVQGMRAESKEERSKIRIDLSKVLDDHEDRLRSVEGGARQGLWRDVGAFTAAVVSGLVAWAAGKPGP